MNIEVRNRQRAHKVDAARLKRLAAGALSVLNSNRSSLSIALVGDAEMARLNKQFHATDGTTDILTFDYGGGEGELIISVPRAVEQAREFKTTAARELALYVVHGILHLHGYDDLKPGPRSRMRAAERRLLARLVD